MPDLLLCNATLPLAHDDVSQAAGVLVRGDRIAAIGSSAQLERDAPVGVGRIDLGGRVLLPAFADPHIHLWKVGQLERSIVDLRSCTAFAGIREALASQSGGDDWLIGRGVNEQRLAERELPLRGQLDQWCGDRPTLITRTCGHIAIANSAALNLAQVDRDRPDPPGGEILRDAAGELTGVLTETAIDLVRDLVPPPTDADRREWLETACRRKIAQGCASATDPGVDDAVLEAYRQVESAGRMSLRCHVMRLAPEMAPNADRLTPAPCTTGRLAVDTAKFFLDGGLSGATAALSRSYRHAETNGVLRMSAEEFSDRATPYAEAGYSIAVHAIGDVAIEAALEAFATLSENGARRRIEHFGLPTADAIRRAKQLGVIIVTQPQFLPELGPNFAAYLPEDFPVTPYPFGSMMRAGLQVAFSSDAPVVVDDSPLAGVAAAVNRLVGENVLGADERVAVRAALEAYTTGAAAAEGVSAERGQIAVGQLADMVVLEQNPLETPAEEIARIGVDMTIIDGCVEHER